MAKRIERSLLDATFSSKNTFSLDSVSPGSPKTAIWLCGEGHEWTTAVRKVIQSKQRCPYCQNKRCLSGFNDLATKRPDLLPLYDSDRNPDPNSIQATHNTKVWWRCGEGHSWEEKPFVMDRVEGNPCPECRVLARSIQISAPQLVSWLVHESDSAGPINSRTPIELKCPVGHHFKESPGILKNSPKCPYCDGRKVLPGFNDLATLHPELARDWDDPRPIETISRQSRLRAKWKCQACGYKWESFVYNRSSGYGTCFRCFQQGGSGPQRELTDFVESLGFKPTLNTKAVLSNKLEIDIYIPEKKIAIEFNGLYWHSSTTGSADKMRHFRKWQECEKLGIQLLVVWDDDWVNKTAIVKRMLTERIVERSTPTGISTFEKISQEELHNFMNLTHIHGAGEGEGYALRDSSGSIIDAIVVRESEERSNYLDVVRYSSGILPENFSKILSNIFQREKNLGFVVVSDNSFSDKILLTQLGFVEMGIIAPDFTYLIRDKRVKKYEAEKSERVIFDYGKILWQLARQDPDTPVSDIHVLKRTPVLEDRTHPNEL